MTDVDEVARALVWSLAREETYGEGWRVYEDHEQEGYLADPRVQRLVTAIAAALTAERAEREPAQRRGWRRCPTHGAIDADHAWGCPDCVREMRSALRNLVGSPVEHDDPRVGYVLLQVARVDLDAARGLVGEGT